MSWRWSPLLALLLAGPAWAEDAPEPTPAERAARVLAALPKPTDAKQFECAGEVLIDGRACGEMSMTLRPAPAGSGAAWIAVDEMLVGGGGKSVHGRLEARLDERLGASEGRSVTHVDGAPDVEDSWMRVGDGYAVAHREGDVEPVRSRLSSPDLCMATWAALLFMASRLAAESDPHDVDLFFEGKEQDEPPWRFVRYTLTRVRPTEPLAVTSSRANAWCVMAKRADELDAGFVVGFRESDGAFLWLEQPERKFVIRARPDAPPFDLTAPARTPQRAALKAVRAFAAGDVEALDALFHWPSIDAALAKTPQLAGLSPEARRAWMRERIERNRGKLPALLNDLMLRRLERALVSEDLGDGRARITLPPQFKGIRLVVRRVGDEWLLEEPLGPP